MTKAAGERIFHTTGAAHDPKRRWEVIPENVYCEARFSSEGEAKQYCEFNSITDNRIWFYNTLLDMERAYKDHMMKHTSELKNWQNPYGHSWYS